MKKLVLLGAGLVATGAAALLTAGVAGSQPDTSLINVVGEPYLKAQQILKSQGIKPSFGGSFGSALPQSQCLVDSQKINGGGRVALMLDCSADAEQRLKAMGPAGGPRVGANGVTTVTPTPMVPIAGAPGAGTPPPT